MNKSLMISVSKSDKVIAWVSNEKGVVIVGLPSKSHAETWLECKMIELKYNCNFGMFNGSNIDLIKRILKAEEIL